MDDEPNVLEGLKRSLRSSYDVTTAVGPEAALQALEAEGPFAAIVSDLSMPNMNGVVFFEESRKISPESARILLTGQADLNTAMAAINRGAIFRFLLKPCAPDVLQEALAEGVAQYNRVTAERTMLHQKHGSSGSAGADTKDPLMKFLVVDSSAIMRRAIINALQRIGYTEVVEASDGEEALDAFGPSIRCVFTDWDLPRMSGLALVRTLRERPHGRGVPILMVTARSCREDILAAKDAGVNSYVAKPFTPQVLKSRLDAVLRASR